MRRRHTTEGGTKALHVTAEVAHVEEMETHEDKDGDPTTTKMASKDHTKLMIQPIISTQRTGLVNI